MVIFLAKRRFQHNMVKDPGKLWFQQIIMKKTVQDKKGLSPPRLDA